MKKRSTIYTNSLFLLALLASSLVAADAPKPTTLKWFFDAPGSFTAAPVVATNGSVYASTVDIDEKSKEERYFLCSITPVEGGGLAVKKWCYLFGSAAVKTSPALSPDETVVYVTSNYNYDSKKRVFDKSIAQITALDSNTDNSNGKLVEKFHSGRPLSLTESLVGAIVGVVAGAPKVAPDTGNIIVNTFELASFYGQQNAFIRQNLHIYRPNGDVVITTRGTPDIPGQLSKFKMILTPAAWLDFEHREPVLNGHGGAVQIVNYGRVWGSLYLADYRHVDTPLRDDTQQAEWPLWRSLGSNFPFSKNSVPQIAVDIRYHRLYFANGGNLYAYKENEENNKFAGWTQSWTKPIISSGAILATVTPTIFTQDTASDYESVVAQAGTLYLGGTNGHVYGVNPDDFGATVLFDWEVSPNALNKRMAIDNTNGILYVVDAKGTLFALDLRAKTTAKSVLWQVDDTAITTAPAVSLDGSVVVGSGTRINAYIGGRSSA